MSWRDDIINKIKELEQQGIDYPLPDHVISQIIATVENKPYGYLIASGGGPDKPGQYYNPRSTYAVITWLTYERQKQVQVAVWPITGQRGEPTLTEINYPRHVIRQKIRTINEKIKARWANRVIQRLCGINFPVAELIFVIRPARLIYARTEDNTTVIITPIGVWKESLTYETPEYLLKTIGWHEPRRIPTYEEIEPLLIIKALKT